jgi:signal transduction histidine kinase
VLYLVAATQSRKTGINAITAALALIAGMLLTDRVVRPAGGTLGAGVSVALAMIIAWSTGNAVRQRRAYATKLQQQATNSAVAEERLRIARELHDVVAHSMSVIAVQAGYGAYVIDGQPDDARAALGAIQATSRDALDEMRRMLGVLRQQDYGQAAPEESAGGTGLGAIGLGEVSAGLAGPDSGARFGASGRADSVAFGSGKVRTARAGDSPHESGRVSAGVSPGVSAEASADAGRRGPQVPLAPAPGLADLDRLIARTGGVGIHVEVQRLGRPREIPAGVDLSAYRIVQEALTNVVKHASTDACRVIVDYGEDVLSIEVTNGGPGTMPDLRGSRGCFVPGATRARFVPAAAGGGHGLIGMRERVGLCSGQFSAGPLPDGGFRVAAHLPLGDGPGAGAPAAMGTSGASAPGAAGRDVDRKLAQGATSLPTMPDARAPAVHATPPGAADIFRTPTVNIAPATADVAPPSAVGVPSAAVGVSPAAVGVSPVGVSPAGGFGGKSGRPTADLPS